MQHELLERAVESAPSPAPAAGAGERLLVRAVLIDVPSGEAAEIARSRADAMYRFQLSDWLAPRPRCDAGLVDEVLKASDRHGGQTVLLRVFFTTWPKVSEVRAFFEGLAAHGDRCVAVIEALDRLRVPEDAPAKTQLVLTRGTSRLLLQNQIAAAQQTRPEDCELDVVAAALPHFFPPSGNRWWWVPRADFPFEWLLSELLRREVKSVVIAHAGARPDAPVISKGFWRTLFSTGIPNVQDVDESLELGPYMPFVEKHARVLFVFPERMLPLRRAFFVRAFDFISHLSYSGHSADVLVFGPRNDDLHRIRRALHAVATRAYAYPLVRGKPGPRGRLVRRVERVVRWGIGHKTPPPLRFSERQSLFGAHPQVDALREVLSNHDYDVVVVTGAWFLPVIEKALLEVPAPRPRIVCDTHDAFFVLDRDSNRDERRLLYSPEDEKLREISALDGTDLVVAISSADAQSFASALSRAPVCVVTGSFEYASRRCRPRTRAHLSFGFMGSGNRNNQASVRILAEHWWPRIIEHRPDAKLSLAGPICETKIATTLAASYPGSVRLLGFVDDVADFYDDVDVVLAPIAVQGGLNFKSVEALVAAKFLLTNEMGTRCLGSNPLIMMVDDDHGNIADLLAEIDGLADEEAFRRGAQQAALAKYGEQGGYAELDAWLERQLA